MRDWQYQFAVLGQQAIEHLQNNPHQGPEAARRLKQLLGEFRRTTGNNNSAGAYSPHRKDGTMQTVMLKDAEGNDVKVDKASFLAATKKVGKKRGVRVSETTYEEDDSDLMEDIDEDEGDSYEERREERIHRAIARAASMKGAVKYNWRYQGRRIAWEWVELAGKAAIIGFVVVGTLWVASRLLAPDEVRFIREGGDGGGGGGGQ